MSLVRTVTVGIQGPNKTIQRITTSVPADWVKGDREALTEIYENTQLRTRLAVAPGSAVWAQISGPYDDSHDGWSTVRTVRG